MSQGSSFLFLHPGLIPLDEATQVRMIKLLLDHGADEKISVENYKPGMQEWNSFIALNEAQKGL